ncbi:MAG: CbiQ family ECF transporter T component [Euzebya sp.]
MRLRQRSGVERSLHPAAWWLWALGLATAASRTTNPLLLLLVLGIVTTVVAARRSHAPWAAGLRVYLLLGVTVIVVRVAFRVLLGGGSGQTVLFTLPQLTLPQVAAGIRLGGPVSLEGLLAALYDGLRLATLLICVGAANLLADPRRLLKIVPSALYEVGTTIVVAVTVAPQLVHSVARVRRARRLRGAQTRGLRGVRQSLLPVLEDALDSSLALAAAMDVRGYGRARQVVRSQRNLTAGLLLVGMMGICVGVYGLLDSSTPQALGLPLLVVGSATAGGGLIIAGRRVARSVYRPDTWQGSEWIIAILGVSAATLMIMAGRTQPDVVFPSLQPFSWPQLPLLATVGVLLAGLPALLAPASGTIHRAGTATPGQPAPGSVT